MRKEIKAVMYPRLWERTEMERGKWEGFSPEWRDGEKDLELEEGSQICLNT